MPIVFRMPISRYRFQIKYRLSRTILLWMTATMRGTDPAGPPECRSTEWSTDWGCFLETNLLRVVTTSEWITSSDLFKCHVAEWSMIESDVTKRAHFKWLQSQGEVQLTSLLQQWFNTVRCSSMNVFLFSVLQGKQIKNVVWMWIDDSRQRVGDPRALIPDVGNGGRLCGSSTNNQL